MIVVSEAESERRYLVCDNVPMFQPTIGEVVAELLGDESRQLGAVFGYVFQELGQVLLYDRVESCSTPRLTRASCTSYTLVNYHYLTYYGDWNWQLD